jgi:hypothetical protein
MALCNDVPDNALIICCLPITICLSVVLLFGFCHITVFNVMLVVDRKWRTCMIMLLSMMVRKSSWVRVA